MGDHFRIAVCFQKSCSERNPLPCWQCSHEIQKEHEQIVGLSRRGAQRFFVIDFEIDQARAIVTRVVDDVRNARVAVRPAPTKFVAPKSVRPPKLSRRCAQHFPSQRTAVQMLPQTFPRQFFGNDCAWPGGVGAKAIAI
ncbi:MAG: hypothetical protein DME57_04685 [Verrucomicrobia bacterium]|nr:MAG: hypothetical protein DME57_04685 [Verrucomicrobiota bacterium]